MPWQMVTYCKPPNNHRTAQLYFLKQIHKNPMGIRPIVSSVNSITENMSKFVDHWLQPIVKQLPSYIKDTTTFANLITQTTVPIDCKLVSIDVLSLYTNTPHHDGLEAALSSLIDHKDHDPMRSPVQILRELMSIVLKTFWNSTATTTSNYKVLSCTKMAPSYVNLFMGKLEPMPSPTPHKHVEKIH